MRVGGIGQACHGLDQAVHGHGLPGQGDHAVAVEEGQGFVDGPRVLPQVRGEVFEDVAR
ncbi:hypothetical protein LUW75_09650 [Streptomyces sp. MRC013]|uniref:hypothetical protein n=1 Tax=Streptomyces sp. MRC013 TaxID=2898276 RepID=UPI00202635FE|nr:hypothetical protein [Streptomyces sp. MRC013]URM90209.1 hypothetical protein LUW75_09650 [Streptomyces sp. MRC013]